MMEKDNSNMTEDDLKSSLKALFAKEEFAKHQQLIKRLSAELQVSYLDCATALSLLNHADIVLEKPQNAAHARPVTEIPRVKQRLVRYRLDIGRKHTVSIDQIKQVLIEVSGVDKKRIGRLDIRNYYTLVDLPEGMPADIFQLLSEVEINQRKLNIKRVKYQPRFYRRNSKQQAVRKQN